MQEAFNESEMQNMVLFKDALMLILNKPSGIACHQGPSKTDFLERYFHHLKYGLPRDPALAHRLDRDTSGCLILGRHRKALVKLGKLFSQSKISKKYWAICEGIPEQNEGVINAPLLKINTKRGWRIVVDEKGQQAITNYKVLIKKNNHCLIEASPQTGRTHQIRIHLKHISCPIIGDPFYNNNTNEEDGNLNLHARSVEVPLYPNRNPIFVECAIPEHFENKLKKFGLLPITHID